MLKNYFIIAFRNLSRQKLYAFINIIGLTIGMTCFILITLYLQTELNQDRYHEKSERIYRIAQQQKGNNFRGTDLFNVAPITVAPILRNEFPEVESATTVGFNNVLLSRQKQVYSESGLYTDKHFFDVFTIPVIEGAGKEAINDPNAILLTESLAKKLFGELSPIGEILRFDNERDVIVRGVIEDAPKNQHLSYDYISSLANLAYYQYDIQDGGKWDSNNYKAYLSLKEGADYENVEKKMLDFNKYTDPAYEGSPIKSRFFLQPIQDIYLKSKLNFESSATSDMRYVYLFGAIGFIILLLASINYMNLATARSANRSKEVGIRKVLGAYRKQIIAQFLGESFILTLIGFLLALIIVDQVLPSFNAWLDREIPFSLMGNGILLLTMFTLALVIGGLSGLYPAVFVSGISPVKAFQNRFLKSFKRGTGLRNTLVVGQFTAAVVLVISTICIYQQLHFIQNKKLGFNRDQVIYIPTREEAVLADFDAIKETLLKQPGINKVSMTANLPLNTYNQGVVNNWEGNDGSENLWIYRNYVDYDFLNLFEIDLVKGRFFSPEYALDSTQSYVLNEAAINALNWSDPIGKSFREGKVIGVVKDFHFQPLDLEIQPQFLKLIQGQGYYGFASIVAKVEAKNAEQVRDFIQKTMRERFPEYLMEAKYLDDAYQKMYESETRFGQIFSGFTSIALLIACMGLFGLVSHQVLQRSKEIGIRKVLGATTYSIVSLISKDFLRLIGLALFLAIPIAWYMMDQWLQNFVYRISIEWWIFLIAGAATIGVALLTVSIQSIRAALMNPTESLKND